MNKALIVIWMLMAASMQAGYDVPAHLQRDLRATATVQLCDYDDRFGRQYVLKPYLAIKATDDVRAVTESLRRVSFSPIPNNWKCFGMALRVALLDSNLQPLFLAEIVPFGDSVTLITPLKRDKKGRLVIVTSNIHDDPPNYSASEKNFRQKCCGRTPVRERALARGQWLRRH